jgi:hypothetical protein
MFWGRIKESWARWRQWRRCCRHSKVMYITRAYTECCVCGAIYWRD